VLPNPIQDFREAEFVLIHRALDELVSLEGFDLDVETVAAQSATVNAIRLLQSRKP